MPRTITEEEIKAINEITGETITGTVAETEEASIAIIATETKKGAILTGMKGRGATGTDMRGNVGIGTDMKGSVATEMIVIAIEDIENSEKMTALSSLMDCDTMSFTMDEAPISATAG